MFGDPRMADLAEVAFLRTSLPREKEEDDRDADTDADNDPYGHAEVPSSWHDRITLFDATSVLGGSRWRLSHRLAEKPRPPQASADLTIALRRRPPRDDAADGWRVRDALIICSIRWRRSILRFRSFWNLALSPLSCDIGFSRLRTCAPQSS